MKFIQNTFDKNELRRLATIFKALSNENRLAIYLRLLSCCTAGDSKCKCDPDVTHPREYVGDIGETVDISPSTVSHHIKELRNVGLIYSERQGQSIGCWADDKILKELVDFFGCWVRD